MEQRLVDANVLKTALYYDVSKGTYGEFMDGSEVSLTDREILKLIDQQPTIDAVPVRHGKWRFVNCATGLRCQCSECLHWVDAGTDKNYCPNCGARMDKE